MQMQKTMVYLPKQLKERILVIANSQGTSQADVIRKALQEGLGAARFQSKTSALGLLKLAKLAEKYPYKGKKTNALEEIDKMWQEWGND
jgi:metal-responsive CopG/Arc/MetJ family transcriptional regulator